MHSRVPRVLSRGDELLVILRILAHGRRLKLKGRLSTLWTQGYSIADLVEDLNTTLWVSLPLSLRETFERPFGNASIEPRGLLC